MWKKEQTEIPRCARNDTGEGGRSLPDVPTRGAVIPAKAGIHFANPRKCGVDDSRFRGNDCALRKRQVQRPGPPDTGAYACHTPGMACWQNLHLPLWMCTVLTVYPVRSTTILRHLGQ